MSNIKELSDLIFYHKKKYYLGEKEIEDDVFDQLENQLKKLDPNNPVLKMVGSDFFSKNKIKHDKKMLSLDKVYDQSLLEKWFKQEKIVGLPKIDGSAVSLIYNNGFLELAKTRGNGQYGENVSIPLSFITSVPNKILNKESLEIRGEVYCSKTKFRELSQEMIIRGLDAPQSERNIVAGILGRKDNQDLAQFLDFYAFDLITDEEKNQELEKLKELEKLQFSVPTYNLITNNKELNIFLEKIKELMANGDYLLDGAVFVINDIQKQKELGSTSHHPKYKMAFKYESESKNTIIKDIKWQISRFGVYTPVAIVEPTEFSGAMISQVTLHNLKHVKAFSLKKGDVIKITRSGEVIPKFLDVIESSLNKFNIPNTCEYCGNELVEEDVRLVCNNEKCSGREKEYLLNFVKKIGIEDLSEKRIELLIKHNLIKSIPDLFKLTKEDLLSLPNFKNKMSEKIIKNINSVKRIDIIKFLGSLNFSGGARKSTELILDSGINSFNDLLNLTEEDLCKIKGFAEKKAKDYISSLHKNKELIKLLMDVGFKIEFPKQNNNSNNLNQISFVVTGSLNNFDNRKDLEKIIKENGGKVSSSVSKNTNYLICNEESSSSKLKKAQSLGVKIITEDQFLKML